MMSFAAKHGFLLTCIRAVLDIGFITLAYFAAVLLCPFGDMSHREALWGCWPYWAAYVAVWCLVNDQQLFIPRRSETIVSLLFSLVRAYITTFLFVAFFLAILMSDNFDRLFFLVFSVFALVALLTFRMTIGLSLSKLRRLGFNTQRIVMVGANERAAHLVKIFQANEQYGYHVEGFLENDPLRHRILERYGIPCLGGVDKLEQLLLERVIDRIYVALPVRSHYEVVQSIAHLSEGIGVPVRFIADFFPLGILSSNLTRMHDIPLLSLTYEPEFQTRFVLRRAANQLAGLILLVFLAPVYSILALLIKLESRGPVLNRFWSEKPDGSMFQLYKFQVTQNEIPENNSSQAVGLDGFSAFGDKELPQIDNVPIESLTQEKLTRVGYWIRKNGLEDLPQLINVIQGDIIPSGPEQWNSIRAKKRLVKRKVSSEHAQAEITG